MQLLVDIRAFKFIVQIKGVWEGGEGLYTISWCDELKHSRYHRGRERGAGGGGGGSRLVMHKMVLENINGATWRRCPFGP